jgi:integrase
MKGHFYKPHCTCPKKDKKCKCGAKWAFIIPAGINPTTGKHKQIKRGGFDTKSDAQDAAAILLSQLKEGTFVEESNIIFKDFVEKWIHYYEATGKVKPGTIRVRKHEINLLSPYFDYLKMREISTDMYQNALTDLKNKEYKEGMKYADNTIDGVHRTGRMIFKWAREKGVIKFDPTEFAYVPKDRKTVEEIENEEEEVKYLEKEQLAHFLDTAKTKGLERDYVIFMVLAYTGMRVGELCALKWRDIDFEEKTISITKTLYNPNNNAKEYRLVPPKTKSARRTIEIDDDVIKVLQQHKAAQNEIRMKYRNIYHDEDFVIAKMKNLYGYPEVIKQVELRTKRLLGIAKLNPDITPHSFRHTHTSLLAEAGVGLQEIMDRLGHKDDKTTKFVYLHVTKTRKKEASQKFAELMRNL